MTHHHPRQYPFEVDEDFHKGLYTQQKQQRDYPGADSSMTNFQPSAFAGMHWDERHNQFGNGNYVDNPYHPSAHCADPFGSSALDVDQQASAPYSVSPPKYHNPCRGESDGNVHQPLHRDWTSSWVSSTAVVVPGFPNRDYEGTQDNPNFQECATVLPTPNGSCLRTEDQDKTVFPWMRDVRQPKRKPRSSQIAGMKDVPSPASGLRERDT